ncbi:Por secretion system C-terminal sorting domain-containing protein [Flavobacteriaceae bacterium MAR_2010_188]|nr:Por secretion system C-terminal sorting domain-containing protein [Flavobacteriaceae bacterium MAR_2010_188]
MKKTTLKLKFLLVFFFISFIGIAQDIYPTVGIVGPATPNSNWDVSVPMELQYADNPNQWMLTVRLTQGYMKFRANDNWEVNWGGDQFPTGTAWRGGPDMYVPETSYYTIYFNDATAAYHFEALNSPVYETIGIRGDATTSGWSVSVPMTVDPEDPHSWSLENITLTEGKIKFVANNDWSVKSWGGDNFPDGTAYSSGNDIVVIPGEYSVTFHDVTGKYLFKVLNAPIYESVGIIGSATANDWASSTPMKRVDGKEHEWILTTYLKVGALKWRANDNWDVDWGATEFPTGIAEWKGPDLQIPESGYYTLRFDDFTRAYSFTKENPETYASVGIIGSATPLGWDNSTPMEQGTDGHTWTLQNFELSSGAVKFRVNNSWDINWGGTEFPTGTATRNGGDIPVTPGFYDITFNDFTLKYSLELIGITSGEIVTLNPEYPTADEQLTIIYDATKGISNLGDASKVYMHSGVIFSGPEGTTWNNVVGNWGQDDGVGEMTPVVGEPGKWQITLSSIRDYYSVEGGEPVFRLGIVFRNSDGTKTGKSDADGDIFVNINPGDFVRFTAPVAPEVFGVAGEQLLISAEASAVADNISIEINSGSGFQFVAQESDTQTIGFQYSLSTSAEIVLKVTAQIGETTVSSEKTISVYLRQPNQIVELPEGMSNGINYDPEDPTKATLVLLASQKEFVYLVGDFNNWEIRDAYQMNQTPDGETFWLEVTGLEAQKEYVYQYWVEGTIKIGDPYADKVADPYSDGNIPAHIYPNPVFYNKTQYGIATVLQTGQLPYQWAHPEVVGGRPVNEDLVVYELLVRDFVHSHSYEGVIEKLPYLKSLGVNAIELLPIMEFENNESWGYNPTYLFASDKYYGTKNDLKKFIDKAHEMGMVVLLDMVLNHQFGQSPMVQMYFDKANNKPAANSPWFNPDATHPFNVGYDMNHESQYTKDYIDDVNRYWIEEFKFDGYRFDLSKGFTQVNNPNDVGAWSAYDQSRIDILKRMSDVIWEQDPEAYVIMEHLSDNSEEKVLADYGIMLWGNMNHQYSELVIGNTSENLSWTLSSTRGWNNKNLIAYMESHDEERLMVRALNSGLRDGNYDIKQKETALERVKLASAFYYPVPGPKMIWQFGELGYDFSINYNGRTGNKPIPWSGADGLGYDQDESRLKLYGTKAAMINLINEYPDVFEEGSFSWTPAGQIRNITIGHELMNVNIIGNFGVTEGNAEVNFQKTGTWYDFYSGEKFVVNSTANTIALSPGEFHILIDRDVNFPEADLTSNTFVFMATPTELDAELTPTFSIALNWKDNSAGESGYLIERKSEDEAEFVPIATLAENVESYFDTGIIDGVTYEYRVKATNTSAGDSGWSNIDVVNLPLIGPSALNAVLIDTRSVKLLWQDNSAHESAYIVERAIERGAIRTPYEAVAELPTNTTTYNDTRLRAGMTYYYRVIAKDSDEVSNYSNVVNIRPADGLKDQLARNFNMYPNPASNQVIISASVNIVDPVYLQITNLKGMVVKSFVIQSKSQSIAIPVNDLPNGLYIVHEVSKESSYGKLLLIQH